MVRRSATHGCSTPPRNISEYASGGRDRFALRPCCYRTFRLLMHSRCLIPNASSSSTFGTMLLHLLEESTHLMRASGCTQSEIVQVMAECTCLVDKLVLSPHKMRLYDEQEWVHVLMICLMTVFLNVKRIQDTGRELASKIWHSVLFGRYCTFAELDVASKAVLTLLGNDTSVCEDLVELKKSILLGELSEFSESGNCLHSPTPERQL